MAKGKTKEWVELTFGRSMSELLREGREAGLSIRQIADDFGVSCFMVHRWLHEYGLGDLPRERKRLSPVEREKAQVGR